MSTILQCPVCGKNKSPLAVSDYDCDNCGFTNAYVRYFATEKGYELWQHSINKAKSEMKTKRRLQMSSSVGFWLGNNAVAFLDKSKKHLSIILNNGKIQHEQNAVGFSASERNHAVLYENGSVKVFGEDNSFSQKNTESWKEIQYVLAAPNCTYGITKSGGIIYAGSLCSPAVLEWKNLKLLRPSNNSIIGLNTNGTVYVANDFGNPEIVADVRKWNGIVDIASARDCIIGLSESGTVKFAGKPDDARRQVEKWENIKAIAVDNAFAYGLSSEGDVYVAGTCKAFLDKGRSKASQWNNILRLSSNQAGISAIGENGELYFAGTIIGDISRIQGTWDAEIKNNIDML